MIKAVVIDDSAFNRVTLTRMLESEGTVRVVATAVDGEDGIKQVMRHHPDVITLDLEMPAMDGFSFLRWLMASRPTPVIVISSRASDRNVFKALELGAFDFIPKPGGRVSPRLEEIRLELVRKAVQCANVRLENVRKRISDEEHPPAAGVEAPVQTGKGPFDCIVIGASTGGPPALQSLFQQLRPLPVPIVVAQHMPPVFTRLFAERVDRLSAWKVVEGAHGAMLEPGVAYVSPGGMESTIQRDANGALRLRVRSRSELDVYAPSVNRLFSSAAEACGARVYGIILTGMGDDGAEGVRVIADRGGKTMAEDASTAIIFGMPAEAIRTGAVQQVRPLHEMSGAIGEMWEEERQKAEGRRQK